MNRFWAMVLVEGRQLLRTRETWTLMLLPAWLGGPVCIFLVQLGFSALPVEQIQVVGELDPIFVEALHDQGVWVTTRSEGATATATVTEATVTGSGDPMVISAIRRATKAANVGGLTSIEPVGEVIRLAGVQLATIQQSMEAFLMLLSMLLGCMLLPMQIYEDRASGVLEAYVSTGMRLGSVWLAKSLVMTTLQVVCLIGLLFFPVWVLDLGLQSTLEPTAVIRIPVLLGLANLLILACSLIARTMMGAMFISQGTLGLLVLPLMFEIPWWVPGLGLMTRAGWIESAVACGLGCALIVGLTAAVDRTVSMGWMLPQQGGLQ